MRHILTYLKLSGINVGLPINFNALHLKDSLKRMVNKLEPPRPSAPSAVKPERPDNLVF